MNLEQQCVLLVLEVSGQAAAFPLEDVQRIVPIAELARPPSLPLALEGVLNLGGTAVSVLRLDRLLGLPPRDPGLYSMVILLKKKVLLKEASLKEVWLKEALPKEEVSAFAVLADRVVEILSVPEVAILPLAEEDSFNGCARAAVSIAGRQIHILSPQRLLLEKEARALFEFQAMAQQRLHNWEAGPQ